jgi:hypothetical protein
MAVAGWLFSRTTGPVTRDGDRSDLALEDGRLVGLRVGRHRLHAGQGLAHRGRRTTAVDPAAVGGLAHLGGHLVERHVEGAHLVLGRGFRPDHRTLREGCQLHLDGTVVLSRVAFALHLDLDPHDPVIVLLQPGELLGHVGSKPVRQLDVATRDDNFHVNLPCLMVQLVGCGEAGVRPADLVFVPTTAC